MTLRRNLTGQRGIDRLNPAHLCLPTITIPFQAWDSECHSLRSVLAVNSLTQPFDHPSHDARKLEIMLEDVARGFGFRVNC